MQSCGLGWFRRARRFFQLWVESQKEPAIRPNPIVDVGRPVSRVEMNAKNAPLTPASPRRRLPTHFLRPRAIKNALTTPTLSYTALHFLLVHNQTVRDLGHFQSSCNAGIMLSHPSRKDKDAARVGHPICCFSPELTGSAGLPTIELLV